MAEREEFICSVCGCYAPENEDHNACTVSVYLALATERERWNRIAELAQQCAEWHMQDSDECGELARELLRLLQSRQLAA